MGKIIRKKLESKEVTNEELLKALEDLRVYDDAKDIETIINLVKERGLSLDKKYYYRYDDKNVGPIDVVEFYDNARNGIVTPETYVWRKGFTDGWVLAEDVYWLSFKSDSHEQSNVSDSTQAIHNKYVQIMVGIICVLLTIALILGIVIIPKYNAQVARQIADALPSIKYASDLQSTPKPTQINHPGISLKEYERIEIGMSYSQVCRIIGSEGKEGMTTARSKSYTWYSESGTGYAVFAFIDGELVTKMDVGLSE